MHQGSDGDVMQTGGAHLPATSPVRPSVCLSRRGGTARCTANELTPTTVLSIPDGGMGIGQHTFFPGILARGEWDLWVHKHEHGVRSVQGRG